MIVSGLPPNGTEKQEHQAPDAELRATQVLEAVRSDFLLDNILMSAPVPVFIKDSEGVYVYVNKSYEVAAGLTADEILGHTDFDLFPPEIASAYRQNDMMAMGHPNPIQRDEPFLVDGDERTYAVVKSEIHAGPNEVAGVFGLSVDITDSLKAEQARGVERQRLRSDAFFTQLLDSLTPQEARVLNLLVEGLSDSEIAERFSLTSGTIRHHVSHLLKKLRKQNRTQAVVEMLKHRRR
ncbi:MAG: rsbT co-antagonist protein RsbR [Actinomycetota bacterium]|jgi:PAS domain S-box-containing protein|nr:rsbT co-antagonist protein RsbR [Actinomycetota bacterium]